MFLLAAVAVCFSDGLVSSWLDAQMPYNNSILANIPVGSVSDLSRLLLITKRVMPPS